MFTIWRGSLYGETDLRISKESVFRQNVHYMEYTLLMESEPVPMEEKERSRRSVLNVVVLSRMFLARGGN